MFDTVDTIAIWGAEYVRKANFVEIKAELAKTKRMLDAQCETTLRLLDQRRASRQ
jgi:hypothetical protein